MSDDKMRRLLSGAANESQKASSARIGRLVRKARRQVATRDVISLGFGRIWVALLTLLGVLFVNVTDRLAKSKLTN